MIAHRNRRAGRRTDRAAALAAVALSLLAVLLAAPVAAARTEAPPALPEAEFDPLAPVDVSGPAATLRTFLEEMRGLERDYVAYRQGKTMEGARRIYRRAIRASRTFDLSEVPPAARVEVGTAAFSYLHDILLRRPPIDLSTVPGPEEEPAASPPREWRLPGLDVVIARVEEGPRAGDWLFSPETVAKLPGYHALVVDRPPVRDSPRDEWRAVAVRFTGPFFTDAFMDALPEASQTPVLGTPVWKVGLATALYLLVLGVTLGIRQAARRLGAGRSMLARALPLLAPAALAWLTLRLHAFVEAQINPSGLFAEGEALLASVAVYGAIAWGAWMLVHLAAEAIIASPAIPEESYDAHLVRLLARVGALVAAGGVAVYGANDIGIPALGLLAGLGVGGFALALAAQSTVENLFGGLSIFADRPFRVGDFILYGSDTGVVESIGPRSTRLRKLDGTLTTVPNGDLARLHVTNFTSRQVCLFNQVLGLRYETSPEQLDWLLPRIRDHLAAHPKVDSDSPGYPRVRLIAFGASSIDVEVRAYVVTADWGEFLAVQERLLLDLMRLVDEAGSGFAFPSTTVYLGRDGGLDAGAKARAEAAARLAPKRADPSAATGAPSEAAPAGAGERD